MTKPVIASTVDLEAVLNAVVDGAKKWTRGFVTPRIEALQEEIAELKARPVLIYRGVWRAGFRYDPGNAVTDRGALWVCAEPTDARPGTNRSWQLAAKASGGRPSE